MEYNKEVYEEKFVEFLKDKRIIKTEETFKIKLFLDKSKNSLQIAKHHKDIKPKEDQPKKHHWNYWAITISYYSILYAAKAAIISKGYDAKDHLATQVALGKLLVPTEIEKEDLEILNEAQKIFEEEYITYFEDARIESHKARYSAIKKYEEKRINEIFEKARKFTLKISLMLQH